MPKIPVYESQRQLTAQAPGTLVDASSYGARGKALQALGQTLGNIALRFESLKNLNEATTAQAHANRRMTDLQMQATEDPDAWDIDKYEKEAQKVREEALGQISDRETRLRFQAQIDKEIETGRLKVFNIKRRHQIEVTRANGLEYIDAIAENYPTARTSKERTDIVANMKTKMAEMLTIEAIDPLKGKEYIEKTIAGLEKRRIISDRKTLGNTVTLQRIRDGEYDVTSEVQEEEITETYKLMQAEQKKFADLEKEAQDKNEVNAIRQLITPGLDENDYLMEIKKLEDEKAINPQIAQVLKDAATSDKTIDATSDAETYSKLWTRIAEIPVDTIEGGKVSSKSRTDLINVMSDAIKSYSAGSITKDELAEIVTYLEIPFTESASVERISRFYKMIGAIRNGIGAIKRWSVKFAPSMGSELQANMIKNYISRIGKDEDSEEALRNVMKDQIKAIIPESVTFDEKGQMMIDAEGNKAIMYPDGSYKEVE